MYPQRLNCATGLGWWHWLVVLSILVLALVGQMPESQAGWVTCPPRVVLATPAGRRQRRERRWQDAWPWQWATWKRYLTHTLHLPMLRSVLLWGLWHRSGQWGPEWVCLVPWGVWLWHSAGLLCPWLPYQPEWEGLGRLLGRAQRGVLLVYLGLALGRLGQTRPPITGTPAALNRVAAPTPPWVLGVGCQVCQREAPWVEVVPEEDGSYTATLCGHFTLRVGGEEPFRKRLLLLFLRQLEVPGAERGSRRTRDGRTPFVRQQYLAQVFQLPQPDLSRIEKDWLTGDWANLLSLKTEEVLTQELRARIVAVFATFPWWGVERVYQHLREQGVAVSERQVRQAAEQSGWSHLRAELGQRYHLTAERIRPRDEWLTGQLLAQVETLLVKLESGSGLTPEERLDISDLQVLAA